MNQIPSLLTLPVHPATGLIYLQEALIAAGLEIQRSFDLQAARASHTGSICPHHGTEQCTCQMVVLQVHGQDVSPVTLVLHGYESITHIGLVDSPQQNSDRVMVEIVLEALNQRQDVLCTRWDWAHAT